MRHRNGPLLVLVGAIAGADVVFAMDSIPAVFGLTRDPYLVLAANVFALLGLRHLYFLIGGLLDRLVYLTAGLSAILAFIGREADRRGARRFRGAPDRAGAGARTSAPGYPCASSAACCVVVTVTSLLATRNEAGRSAPPGQRTQLSGHLVRRDLPSLTSSPLGQLDQCPRPAPACPR